MAHVSVKKISQYAITSGSILQRLDGFDDKTRKVVYEISWHCGDMVGVAMNDWLSSDGEVLMIPTAKVVEKEDVLEVTANLPGFSEEDLTVIVLPSALIVAARSKKKSSGQEDGAGMSEPGEKMLLRRIELPVEINTDRVQAELNDGTLSVTAAKPAHLFPKLSGAPLPSTERQ